MKYRNCCSRHVPSALFLGALSILVGAHPAIPADPPVPAPANVTEQPTVRRIESYAHIAAFLNLAQGTVRLVAVLPVEDLASTAAIDTVAAVVRGNPSKRLRAYVILRGSPDSSLLPAALAGRAADPRIVCFWDPKSAASGAWDTNATPGVWLYDTSAKFVDGLPEASLVVKTLAKPATPLDGPALRNRAGELVRRVEAKVASNDDGS